MRQIADYMEIKTFYFNPYRECTYVVQHGQDIFIVDPGMYTDKEVERLMHYLKDSQLTPTAYLITHSHPDHICGVEALLGHYPDLKKVSYQSTVESVKAVLSGCQIIPTPGHKEDSVCYYFPEEKVLFTGDTLFQESIGRTDLPGGDMGELMRSLKTLAQLPEDTQVYPGHGYATTIGHEKTYNPYL